MKVKAIVFILLSVLLLSCKEQQQTVDVDFGEATFHEPFQGLLSSHPQWLLQTLDWPILRGLRPDTVCEQRTVEIEFNEEAVRSKSKAELYIQSGDAQNGIEFFCNGERLGDKPYEITATAEKTEIVIACKILPLYNDSVFSGDIYIGGTDLDEVNGLSIHSDSPETIGTWRLDYNRGWSICWLIWFLMLLLAILLIGCVLWGLYYVIKFICVFIAEHPLSIPSPHTPSADSTKDSGKRTDNNSSDESSDDKKLSDTKKESSNKSSRKTKKGTLEEYLLDIKTYEKIVYDIDAPCTEREHALEWICGCIEQIDDADLRDNVDKALRPMLRIALVKLRELWNCKPRAGAKGYWEQSANGQTFVLNRSAANYEECKYAGMVRCEYTENGIPDFSRATEKGTIVDCSDLYDEYTSEELSISEQQMKSGMGDTFTGSFYDKAQERIADNKIKEIRAYWKKSHPSRSFDKYRAYRAWRDNNDLVPCADANCETMRLVERSVYDTFRYSDGISRIRIIKEYFKQTD